MKILLACGGTGGHLFPAMGLSALLNGKHDLLFVTGSSQLEKELFYEETLSVRRISAAKLPSFRSWHEWPLFLRETVVGLKQSFDILDFFHPDIVIAFGSYSSTPVLMAACFRRVPILLHEQNIIPGRANRLFSRWAKGVGVSFPQAVPFWNAHHNVKITGNPGPLRWQKIILQNEGSKTTFLKQLKLETTRETLLVMGGSQGAHAINQLVSTALAKWFQVTPEQTKKIQIIHLTGETDFEQVKQIYERLAVPSYIAPFHEKMYQLYQVSSLAVTRAGATSLSELAHFGVPAILIPYPYAGDHQSENARVFEKEGAAVVLEQSKATPETIMRLFDLLFSSQSPLLEEMKQAVKRLTTPNIETCFQQFIEAVR